MAAACRNEYSGFDRFAQVVENLPVLERIFHRWLNHITSVICNPFNCSANIMAEIEFIVKHRFPKTEQILPHLIGKQ